MKTLIVFSHLRWNFVFQRPQHLLSRLARKFKVVFVEEPFPGAEGNHLERLQPVAGVEVWRPHLAGSEPGFHDNHLPALKPMIEAAIRDSRLQDYGVWFYTPMAIPLVADLEPRVVVYDCMDELASFKNAPRQLMQRENALFKMADLVFTGGRSLFEAKRHRHANVHCFPSSVDAQHFTSDAGRPPHPAQPQADGPLLGYCGVIDERIDLGLIADMARQRPQWQFVMVGPTAKLDPAVLPREPNVHWLGQRDYGDLPSLISGWDICLMPFALNEATRFISPTKTLEYMACGKPCVSTAIKDVVDPYSHVVSIASDSAGFIAACGALLTQSASERTEHARRMAEVVGRTSWDRTAEAMVRLIEAAAAQSKLDTQSEQSGTLTLGARESRPLPKQPAPMAAGAG